MKARKGWKAIDSTGTSGFGDCPKWAEVCRRGGMTVVPVRIYGKGAWPCGSCLYGLVH